MMYTRGPLFYGRTVYMLPYFLLLIQVTVCLLLYRTEFIPEAQTVFHQFFAMRTQTTQRNLRNLLNGLIGAESVELFTLCLPLLPLCPR